MSDVVAQMGSDKAGSDKGWAGLAKFIRLEVRRLCESQQLNAI